jgi:hypothetical protein
MVGPEGAFGFNDWDLVRAGGKAMKFTVILTPDEEDGGYVAECPSIPGCLSEGDTVEASLPPSGA